MMLDEKRSRGTWQDAQADVSQHGHSEPPEETKGGVESGSATVTDGEDGINFFAWLLVACSSISGLLFGAFFDPISCKPSVCDHLHLGRRYG